MSAIRHCPACNSVIDMNDGENVRMCMAGNMHFYVCNSKCMHDFYNPKKKEDVAEVNRIKKEEHIIHYARMAHLAWLEYNTDRMTPDLSNHYTARQSSTNFTHAMLALGLALEGK